jgi:hypothetical protein
MECDHFWILDHKKFFKKLTKKSLLQGLLDSTGRALLFPAMCLFCKKDRRFNKKEWEDMLKEQQHLKI